MKKYTKFVGIVASLLILFHCSKDDKPVKSELQLAKEAVQQVRNWSDRLRNIKTVLNEREIKQKQEMADAGIDMTRATVGESLNLALVIMFKAYSNHQGVDGDYALEDEIINYLGAYPNLNASGVIKIGGGKLSLQNAVISLDGIHEDLVREISITLPLSTVGKSFSLTMEKAAVENDIASAVIHNGSVVVEFEQPVDILDNTVKLPTPLSIDYALESTITQSAAKIPNPVSFTGTMELSAVRYNLNTVDGLNPKHYLMRGTLSNQSGEFLSCSFEFAMTNADSFKPVESATPGSIRSDLINYSFSADGNTFTINYPNTSETYVFDPVAQTVTTGNSYVFTSVTDFESFLLSGGALRQWHQTDDGQYTMILPEQLDPAGGTIDASLDWSLLDDETAENFRQWTGKFTFSAKIEGLPQANFIYDAHRTGLKDGAGSVTISYDNVVMELAVNSVDKVNNKYDASLNVKVRNGKNLTVLVIRPVSGPADLIFVGEITVNGVKVATIEEELADLSLLVTYSDGTFESVNY